MTRSDQTRPASSARERRPAISPAESRTVVVIEVVPAPWTWSSRPAVSGAGVR